MKIKYLPILFVLTLLLGFLTISDFLNNRSFLKPPKNNSVASIQNKTEENIATIQFKNVTVKADIADTETLREKGLSFRENLDANSGMLFKFNGYQKPFFWMKDMLFPLDIIWIKDDVVIDIDKNLSVPEKDASLYQLPKYSPKESVNYVLEVNGGFADLHKIEVYDPVSIEL